MLTSDEIESRRIYAKIMAEQSRPREDSLVERSEPGATPGPSAPASITPSITPSFDPAYGLRDLIDVWYLMQPEVKLYDWQAEELLRISGFPNANPNEPRVHYTAENPLLLTDVCANGSGKDMTLIRTVALGLPLLYRNVFVVITSASNDQLKHQTENHITRGITALNSQLGHKVYESIHYYHRCEARGGEIKLFATDEAGRAEGWHPMTKDGKLVIIVNEAKSITPEIFIALDRCSGYTHWLEISSPGPRRGMFYDNFKKSIKHPALWTPGKFYGRQVTGWDCPHKTKAEHDRLVEKHGLGSFLVQTSWYANFYEETQEVVIPAGLVEDCARVEPVDGDIGIGLDCAAGGDETVLAIRRGNHLIDLYCFTESNLDKAYELIDARLDPYRYEHYEFNIDDGGIGAAFTNALINKGWNVIQRHSQSSAYQRQLYLNLGAEMWWHCRDLFAARVIAKYDDEVLNLQLTTRKDNKQEGQGKHKLDSKKRIKELGGASPDRADAFVLAFFSFRPTLANRPDQTKPETDQAFTPEELIRHLRPRPNFSPKPKLVGSPYYSSL